MTQTASKFASITGIIRQRISMGIYPVGSKLPSVNELPVEFGVGKQTIVRVLSELSREGLIVQRQGRGTYVASSVSPAQKPAEPRALKIGLLLWRSIKSPDWKPGDWFHAIAQGVAQGLGMECAGLKSRAWPERPGAATRLSVSHPASLHRIEVMGEPRELDSGGTPLDLVFGADLDAIVPISIFREDYLLTLLERARSERVPVVIADYWTKALGCFADCVVSDSLPGYLAGCEWLFERGMRRIHFVGAYSAGHTPGHFKNGRRGGMIEPDSFLRLSAYRQALDEAGIAPSSDWVHFARPTREAAVELAARLARLDSEQRPDALVCHAAGMAEALAAEMKRTGTPVLAIGAGQAGVRGACGLVEVNAEEMGCAAALQVLSRLRMEGGQEQKGPAVKVSLPTRFVPGEES